MHKFGRNVYRIKAEYSLNEIIDIAGSRMDSQGLQDIHLTKKHLGATVEVIHKPSRLSKENKIEKQVLEEYFCYLAVHDKTHPYYLHCQKKYSRDVLVVVWNRNKHKFV